MTPWIILILPPDRLTLLVAMPQGRPGSGLRRTAGAREELLELKAQSRQHFTIFIPPLLNRRPFNHKNTPLNK